MSRTRAVLLALAIAITAAMVLAYSVSVPIAFVGSALLGYVVVVTAIIITEKTEQ